MKIIIIIGSFLVLGIAFDIIKYKIKNKKHVYNNKNHIKHYLNSVSHYQLADQVTGDLPIPDWIKMAIQRRKKGNLKPVEGGSGDFCNRRNRFVIKRIRKHGE